jgi:hypothetical protein
MYYIWGTRILSGDFTYEFAMLPFAGPWQAADLHRNAVAYNFPAIFTCGTAGDGTWGGTFQPIRMEAGHVLLSALYVRNGRLIARMYEGSGRAETARLRIEGGADLRETDLRGMGNSTVSDAFDFRPWQIRTIRFNAGNP